MALPRQRCLLELKKEEEGTSSLAAAAKPARAPAADLARSWRRVHDLSASGPAAPPLLPFLLFATPPAAAAAAAVTVAAAAGSTFQTCTPLTQSKSVGLMVPLERAAAASDTPTCQAFELLHSLSAARLPQ
eukprot:CAMPEP_0171673008 /NCGR_PEP_ID=MMETSP0990-20121206/52319_1 /TAXON_ID=483369 /ORGANISM="non described non described, Strain CCMP2098" /LENGTH=130 /DNA_ID=CAMNT_0012258387 /DNA_START=377 /DNA_END=768 /DNA_ORIENTATION=+